GFDRAEQLGADRVGYRSYQGLCPVPEGDWNAGAVSVSRFELQVRSVLQHAWAELAHQLVYKAVTPLGERTKRRFNLVAGMLEVADRELDSIALEGLASLNVRIEVGELQMSQDLTMSSLRHFVFARVPLLTGRPIEAKSVH